MRKLFTMMALACVCLCSYAQETAQDSSQEETMDSASVAAFREFVQAVLTDSVKGQKGTIELKGTNGYVQVPDGYQLLDPKQANHLLVDYWGNTEDEDILGALVIDTVSIYDELETAFIVYYQDCGYVKDDDAADIDYDEMLENLKESAESENKVLAEQGLATYEVVDWAEQPYYDKNKKVLYWAKHLRFTSEGDSKANEVLNYDMRVLGRKGMFLLTAVSDMNELSSVKKMNDVLLDNVKFNEGYTYADFDSTKDNIAEWTVGGLIAGNILAKTGILAKLGLLLAKFWKILLLAFVGIGAFVKKIFGVKSAENSDESAQEDSKE